MNSILTTLNSPGNEMIKILLLSLACFRIYLEIIGFDFSKLPFSKALSQYRGNDNMKRWHRTGLIFSVGYLAFNAPAILLAS